MRSSLSFINAWLGAFNQPGIQEFFIVIVFFPLLEKLNSSNFSAHFS